MLVDPTLLWGSDLRGFRALTVGFLELRDLQALRCSKVRFSLASVECYRQRADDPVKYKVLYAHLQYREE